MINKLLSKEELKKILSMSRYWDEVSKRDYSAHILKDELNQVYKILGLKLLLIVQDYANEQGWQEFLEESVYETV